MDKPEQENGGRRTGNGADAAQGAESPADGFPAELRVSQEDAEAAAKESQAVLEASSKLLAGLDTSAGQLNGVVQELEREIERARDLLGSGSLSPEAAGQINALLGEVLPECFAHQGEVRMASLAALGGREDVADRTAGPGSNTPGKARRGRGRTAV